MSIEKEAEFDPYHKWLGIQKTQRPPTHYQILGLTAGESDTDVIEAAAMRQTMFLRAYQIGPHADDCTRLLNEIAVAQQVLLNPQKRSEYDCRLGLPGSRIGVPPGRPAASARPAPASPPLAQPIRRPAPPKAMPPMAAPIDTPPVGISSEPFGAFARLDNVSSAANDGTHGDSISAARRSGSKSRLVIAGAAVIGFVLVAGILAAIIGGSDRPLSRPTSVASTSYHSTNSSTTRKILPNESAIEPTTVPPAKAPPSTHVGDVKIRPQDPAFVPFPPPRPPQVAEAKLPADLPNPKAPLARELPKPEMPIVPKEKPKRDTAKLDVPVAETVKQLEDGIRKQHKNEYAKLTVAPVPPRPS